MRFLWSSAEDDERPELASPKMMVACPQPRRIFVPGSTSPSVENTPGSPWSTQDEACNELRELLGTGKGSSLLFDGQPYDARPLSSVSTCAGPSPGLDERGFTPAYERAETPQSPILEEYDQDWAEEGAGGAQLAQGGGVEGGRASRATPAPAQVRKVFVGGIPQNMNQDDLYTVFSNFAGVKKAWLQKHRAIGPGISTTQRNHRGFGFVIFHDGSAVENLLGQSNSRFISLPDGRKLEVKRAVSSNDMAAPSGPGASGPVGTTSAAPTKPEPRGSSPPSPAPDAQWSAAQGPWAGTIPVPPPLPPISSGMPSMQQVPSVPSMQARHGPQAALAAWPAGSSGGVPTMIPAQQGYPGVAGIYVATSAGTPNVLLQPRSDVAQMVPGNGAQIMLAPGPPVCEQMHGAVIQKQTWVVDPSSQAAMQITLNHVPAAAVQPLVSPQPVLARWGPAPVGGGAPPQWTSIPTPGGAMPPQTQGPACAVQWVQGRADLCPPAGLTMPDANTRPAMPDAACSRGGAAGVVLPNGLMGPESQQNPYSNIKELESALLQAMPAYYDD